MDELIKVFNETGNCEVDVAKVAAAWNDKFSISQYNDKYRLIEQIELFKESAYKINISKEQALEIIDKAKLLQIRSTFFRNTSTWRSKSNIISEISRFEQLLVDNPDSGWIKGFNKIVAEFKNALVQA